MVRSGLIRVAAVLTAFHALAVGLALALLVAAMKLGLFGDVTIMFYRGLVDLAAITPVLMLVLAGLVRLRWVTGVLAARDAVAATLVAISLNLAAFVLGPVTVDRSVSVYMLSRLAEAPLTADDLGAVFTAEYVGEWDQIGRRLKEQIASRNIEETADGRYRLTAQGRSFLTTAQAMSRLFGGDPRFVGIAAAGQVRSAGGSTNVSR